MFSFYIKLECGNLWGMDIGFLEKIKKDILIVS